MARSVTSHDPAATGQRRALVRQAGGPEVSFRLEFDARTAYDFMVSLTAMEEADYDLLPEDERWLAAARASLSAERRADLQACFVEGPKAVCFGVAHLPLLHPQARTARELVAELALLDSRQLMRELLSSQSTDPELVRLLGQAVDGDPVALDALPTRLPESEGASVRDVLASAGAWSDRLRGLLVDWLPRYEEVEPRVARMMARDLESRQADAELPPQERIEKTTGGLRWLPERGVQRVVLAPGYFNRPFNYAEGGPGWRLFVYPIADGALDRADELAPPAGTLRLYRALGDESRLRILRLLADRDLYLTEIAQLLELSKPTVKHHLAQLRAAGLVTTVEEANMTYYSLRRDRLDEASSELHHFLG